MLLGHETDLDVGAVGVRNAEEQDIYDEVQNREGNWRQLIGRLDKLSFLVNDLRFPLGVLTPAPGVTETADFS